MKLSFRKKKQENDEQNPEKDGIEAELTVEEQLAQELATAKALNAGKHYDEEEEEKKKRGGALLLRRRALIKAAKRIGRTKKLTLFLAGASLLLGLIFTISVVQEHMGNFTININRMDMYKQGIMLSNREDFEKPTARLKARAVQNATNISIKDLPLNLTEKDGEHNGKDYMAYTFYVKNGGKKTIDYYANIVVEMKAKGVEDAIRVAVYKNKEARKVYAKLGKNGKPEKNTIPFVEEDIVMEQYTKKFKPGAFDKFTVVLWIEGDDPQCVDAIIGGMIRMSMNIEVAKPIDDR